MLIEQKGKHLLRKDILCFVFPNVGDVDEVTRLSENPFWDDRVHVGAPMNKVTERLGCCDHCRHSVITLDFLLKDFADGVIGGTTELTEEFAVVSEVDPQALGYSEDPLTVGYLCEKFFIEPMSEQQNSFLVAGRTA